MNTRHASPWFWPALAVVFLCVLFVANDATTQSQTPAEKPVVKTAGGLTTVTFYLERGELTVNLPDDIRAGDTISGTVVADPKGQTKEERANNQSVLQGLVIEIDGKRVEPFSGEPAKERETTIQQTFWIYTADLPKSAAQSQPGDVTARPVPVSVGDGEKDLAQASILIWQMFDEIRKMTPPTHPSGAIITPDPKITPPTHPSGAIITPDPKITPSFIIPPLGQTGRPIVITGPFDGNASNTTLNWSVPRTMVQDFEKNTENVSGGFGLIAESPRKAVFTAPGNVTGPIELHLTEGNTQSTGSYRNVRVNLSAPKTSLLKGEKTELRVEVSGLQGITAPVPLTLESRGVITMEGGTYQPLVIQPSQVGGDGRYSTTRGIAGLQAGGWEATATVVTHRFDACLQDDTAPARRILWNTFNGEYIFIKPLPPATPSGHPQTDSTTPPSLTGTGKITMKGCVFTLEHNAPDRRVMSRIDQCTNTGSASVETASPKVKFTITDRSTTDNICTVQ